MNVVPDASAVASFLLPDEAGPFADLARSICATAVLVAPAHWPIELASLLRKAQHRKRIGEADLRRLAEQAQAIVESATVIPAPSVREIVGAAQTAKLTVYDAPYLLLAQQTGSTLLSADLDLLDAARALGISVVAP